MTAPAVSRYKNVAGAVAKLVTVCAVSGQIVVSGNSGTLGLDKSTGCWNYDSINLRNDPKNPNIINHIALVKPNMFIGWTTTESMQIRRRPRLPRL